MKNILRNSKTWGIAALAFIFVVLLFVKCVYIDELEAPEEANAGDNITLTMHTHYDPAGDGSSQVRLVVGFMAPESWNAGEHTTVTYTTAFHRGVSEDHPDSTYSMSPMPEDNIAPNSGGRKWPEAIRNQFGIGENYIEKLEWVVFRSDLKYDVVSGDHIYADVNIKTKTGMQNLLVRLGVFLGDSNDGLNQYANYSKTNRAAFTPCFEAHGGVGNIQDFCNPALNKVFPAQTTDNDFVTFRYQGDVQENVLDGASEVYLCATAHTDQGRDLTVCQQNEKTMMQRESQYQRLWKKTIWPRGFFNVDGDETITDIDYSFKNESGSKELMNESTGEPFSYIFVCSIDSSDQQ